MDCLIFLAPYTAQWSVLCVIHGVCERGNRPRIAADSSCNCGFPAVAAHQQGRRHPFRAAEADLMVHPVQITMEIPQLPVDKVVDVSLRSSTSLL